MITELLNQLQDAIQDLREEAVDLLLRLKDRDLEDRVINNYAYIKSEESRLARLREKLKK